jgi:uncharacterized protein (DUF302 family)
MSVSVRACAGPAHGYRPRSGARRGGRALGAVVAIVLAVAGCGSASAGASAELAPPPAPPGQAPGTLVVSVDSDVADVVQRVRDAVSADGGRVVAVVDHSAGTAPVGRQMPPTSLVIGGPPAPGFPLLRLQQRATVDLPQRYLIRQTAPGAVTVTANSPEYVAAMSAVVDTPARFPLRDATAAVLDRVSPGSGSQLGSPLLGVTPTGYLVTASSNASVPVTVDRLRRAADRPPTRTTAVVDMAAGSAEGGPALRPTSLVLVSLPDAEAALIAAAPTFGLDLPLRFAVWQDEQNVTQVAYPDVRRLAARHGVPTEDANVVRLVTEADRLVRIASGQIR